MSRFLILLISLFSISTFAAIKTEVVEYKEGDTVLEGFLAYNDSMKGKKPGVIIVHEWMGVGDYVKNRARQLAELGYVAFAADIYGKGTRPKDQKEAAEFATKYRGDRKLLRARAMAAHDYLSKHKRVDSANMLAMGYCFGGTTVLEMGLAGAPLKGIVSFHGGLEFPTLAADAKNIKAPLLIEHGAIDPFVPQEQVNTFLKALNDNKVNYEFVAHSGAVHGFTQQEAGTDPSKGMAYNAQADKRSFEDMKDFFQEVTKK